MRDPQQQILHKPSRLNPELDLRTGEAEQMAMLYSREDKHKIYQKETMLLGARLEGFVNLREERQVVFNCRLLLVDWPPAISRGEIRNWPELDLTYRTLVALQEGYRSLKSFEDAFTAKGASKIRQLFIAGERTLYWHRIDRSTLREVVKK